MSIANRPYWKDNVGGGTSGGFSGSGLTWGLPRLTPVVKWLLIINVAVFVAQKFFDGRGLMSENLGVSLGQFWAFWTYVTFQFLHSNVLHILLNMLGVYFFGTMLEESWGGKAFLRFYLGCGAAAGLLYVAIGAIAHTDPATPLIGASGGVFGLLLACAVYFPQFRVVFFIFPVPIRLAAVLIYGLMILTVINAAMNSALASVMSDIAHLGGALAAAFRIWARPTVSEKTTEVSSDIKKGSWKRKIAAAAAEEKEVDRILEKIQREGIGALSNAERRTLQQATENQREKDKRIRETFKNR